MNVGDVLDGMFRLFARNWRAYIGAVAAIVVPVQLVVAFLQRDLAAGAGLIEILSDPMAAQSAAAGGPAIADIASAWFASAGIALLVTPLVTGIACLFGARAHLGEEVDAGLGLRAGFRRYLALVSANLLRLLALIVTAALFIAPVAAMIAAGGGVVAGLLLLPMGLLALGAVMVVYTFMLVWPAAVMVEGLGPVAGIARSARLVRARFWPVLGVGLLAFVISSVISSVLTWPFSLPAALFGGMAFVPLTTAGAIVAGVVSAPLMPNAIALLYLDLRVRAEGMDLEAMASAVERPDGGGRPG